MSAGPALLTEEPPLQHSAPGAAPLPGAASDPPLRVGLLAYRGNPRSGGQGVYVRHLSRALTALGHRVEVISGPPYPEVDDGVSLTRLPGLDLYREPDPFRLPRLSEFRSAVDALEFALMCTAGFPEPLTFSLRAWCHLRGRISRFDVLHDNQGLGYGMLALARSAVPVLATIHHPIPIDRQIDIAHAASWRRRATLCRWYGFTRMQRRVARRLPRLLTVSETARQDIVRTMGVHPARIHAVPLGVDADLFRPLQAVVPVPGRIVATTSSDVPLKGLVTLIRAMPRVRERHPGAHLIVVGTPRRDGEVARALAELDLDGAVRFHSRVSEQRLVELYAQAEVAAVPSLYEGFCLPAVEAMACGTALVATTGGALPEIAGEDGRTAVLVPPGDFRRLATALVATLGDPGLRRRVGTAGRRRALELFTWEAAARRTAAHYREVIAAGSPRC